MALEILWSKRAQSNFNIILEHLELSFSESTAKGFAARTYNTKSSIEHRIYFG